MRRYVVIALAVLGLGGGVYLGSAARSEGAASTAPASVAVVTSDDFRVVVTAAKGASGGGAPTAVVTATTFERTAGRWQRTGTYRLNGTYFWNTVTGPRALCQLELRTAGARPGFRPQVRLQLLVSPALGCGRTHSYALTRRR
jgi:hypothetical protein